MPCPQQKETSISEQQFSPLYVSCAGFAQPFGRTWLIFSMWPGSQRSSSWQHTSCTSPLVLYECSCTFPSVQWKYVHFGHKCARLGEEVLVHLPLVIYVVLWNTVNPLISLFHTMSFTSLNLSGFYKILYKSMHSKVTLFSTQPLYLTISSAAAIGLVQILLHCLKNGGNP